MLPGWCCIAIAALELGNGDSWYHMCAFRSIPGPESQLKSGFACAGLPAMLSSILVLQMPPNWSADHQPCFLLLVGFALFCCVLCLVLCVCFVAGLFLHGVSQCIVYWSISVLFCMHIVVATDVATALIRWICKRQLYFRLDKRSGESHLALDGKKSSF